MRKEFWDVNRRLLKISSSGRIYFTDEGKQEYRSLFTRYGYSIDNVTTLEEFRRVMQNITAIQMEHSNDEILRSIHNPLKADRERAALGAVTAAMPLPQVLERPAAQVVSLAAWRSRATNR